jgi:hypothetical protein
LWIIIRYGQEKNISLSKTSRFRHWYVGIYEDIAKIKGRYINKKYFRSIFEKFPPKFGDFKELGEKLRRILFSIREELFFTEIYRNSDKLYISIIDAFERAIAKYIED